ncbi:MAG TPA: hypothetical protein VN702_16250 [Acetobacteraceae bacterium]|nr:hypothetical protein [Acetobacteraceae bacterium]
MNAVRVLALPALLLLAGCGGNRHADTPEDAALRRNAQSAGMAFSLERPAEAAAQYGRALERARARDDAGAIGDYGYDMAVAQLAANRPKDALATVRMTRAELARRGKLSFPALDLAEATALYRLGNKTESSRIAGQVEATADPAAAARASFLRGLIADETGDMAGLDNALTRLARPASTDQQADLDELLARQAMHRRQFQSAATDAEHAADLRRTILDYRGMARALAVAADAEAHAGNLQAAAKLYMRAGQSAAAQGDTDAARQWLRRAAVPGSDPATRRAAQQALAALPKGPVTPARR